FPGSPIAAKYRQKGSLLPFTSSTEVDDEGDGAIDIVTQAEASTKSMDTVFRFEPFVFSGCVDGTDIGPEFNSYFSDCVKAKYDRSEIADFLALNGVLFLGKEPTSRQRKAFGDKYSRLAAAMEQRILQASEESIKEGVAAVRNWKDVYKGTLRIKKDKDEARAAMERAVDDSMKSSLKSLFMHGCCNLPSDGGSPWSESDQTSSFVLPMLSCIINKPDQIRLMHTATTPTTGSLFVRLCKDLEAPPKHPDLIIKHRDTVDVGFGEVSFTSNYGKDQGDLCRLAIWAKRALDQLQTQFEGLQDLDLFFFQIISTHCTIYQACKVGTICVVFKMEELDVVHHLGNLLSFEDQ
ncbi:hypothetical protein BGX34_006636, partial [Mortierella sp. NVP85]